MDRAGADLIVRGHAHRGSEHGITPGRVNVRNVAESVIRQGYAVYTFSDAAGWLDEVAAREAFVL